MSYHCLFVRQFGLEIYTFWREINYCVQKHITDCHAKLHVTLSKHQNEINAIKAEEHNNKSAGRNVPMAKCHKAITKEQFSIARCQNEMTKVQVVMFQWQNVRMEEQNNKMQ